LAEPIIVTGLSTSIPFINPARDIQLIKTVGAKHDLNTIELGLPRKEFVVLPIYSPLNCASFSCPKLLNEAYKAEKIDQQLDKQAKAFINNPAKNKIEPAHAEISKIFRWYKGDFTTNDRTLIDYSQ
jgi:hypothetical protein